MDILPQLLVNALIAGSIYALASSGLALTYGQLRILNFAHGHLMMVGAYAFFFANNELALPLVSSAFFTLLASILIGIISLRVFVIPFSKISLMLTFITTLSLSNILEAAVSMFFGVNVHSLSQGSAQESFSIGSIYITPIQIIIIISALVILSCLAMIIHRTAVGRAIRAYSEDPEAAEGLGISSVGVSYLVFITGTILAAYAGVLVGYETNIQPTMGGSYTIKAFAAMILGGLGNLWGTIIGSFLLGLIENLSIGLDFGDFSIPAGYKDAFSFAIILLMLLFRPQGILGSKSRRA